MIRKRLFAATATLLLAVAGATAQIPIPFNGIQAIVNDTVISRDQVLGSAQRALTAAARTAATEQEYLSARVKVLEDQLEQLIDRQLILDEFKQKGYNFPDSFVDDAIRYRIKKDFGGDRVALTRTLRAENRTFEQFKKDEREDMIIYQMTVKNIREELVISPKKIENYYRTNAARFNASRRVKLRMIVVDRAKHTAEEAAKLAAAAHARLMAGEDFAKVADEVSDDARRFKGGDRGWTEDKSLRDELKAAAFGIAPGRTSDVLDIAGTRFILKVEDKQDAGVKPLSEVRQEIESALRELEQKRLQKQWLAKLRKKGFVRYF